jgi:hypothetical protein
MGLNGLGTLKAGVGLLLFLNTIAPPCAEWHNNANSQTIGVVGLLYHNPTYRESDHVYG